MRAALARWSGALACALVLAGCATPQRTAPPGEQSWAGRMGLTVQGRANDSFSAGFELRGAPQAGELRLTNPLGGTIALLSWSPGKATLRSNGRTREFPSVEALAEEATGAPLPLASLFDWLAGKATPVPGWTADLSQLAQGRLRAHRTEPPPPADLRLILEH